MRPRVQLGEGAELFAVNSASGANIQPASADADRAPYDESFGTVTNPSAAAPNPGTGLAAPAITGRCASTAHAKRKLRPDAGGTFGVPRPAGIEARSFA